MPEYIKALVVILFLALSVFYFLRIPASEIIGTRIFNLRRNLWFCVTLIAFLAPNYWTYVFLTWMLLLFAMQRDKNKVALFLFLLFTVPQGGYEIPGFGLINYFFLLNHQRLLALCILLPVFLRIMNDPKKSGSRNNTLDILVLSFIILTVILQFRGTTVTDALRSMFYEFIDIYLPYFVVSRVLSSIDDFKDTLFSYVCVIMVLSAIGLFEIVKYWHVYSGVEDKLGLEKPSFYLQREGYLRARASVNIIPLGYVIAIGLGFHLYFSNLYSRKGRYHIITGSIIAGLLSPLSRGPWVGAALLVGVYLLFSPNKMRKFPMLLAAFALFALIVSFTPLGSTLMGLIPFVGDVETGNITYRQQLITNAMIVIMRNPLLGSIDYLLAPEMEALRTGQGIIDVVNTYISVALKYGLVGLSLFAGIFIYACLKIFTTFTKFRQIETSEKNLGKILLATLLCIMITIFTVSSISVIPIMYWILLGMCSAYIRMIEKKKRNLINLQAKTEKARSAEVNTRHYNPHFRFP